jgi:LmbE family N-acetylglucosaminyl deacetylase
VTAALVAVAHPDDEVLGFAGVIARLQSDGRRVRVAVLTNGDSRPASRLPLGFCGAQRGIPSRIARFGTCRNRETVGAAAVLGLHWSLDARASDVLFLGYPNFALETIARRHEPWEADASALHHTYALGRNWRSCDGDLRFLLDGRHSRLCNSSLAADVDALLEITAPTDIYTHAEFDGHPDHAETHRQLLAAVRRLRMPVTVHSTLIHPQGSAKRMHASALEWPNPAQAHVPTPFDRFTPQLGFEPPPLGVGCSPTRAWGPLGAPTELVAVPESMYDTDPSRNLKWRAISQHRSQIVCRPGADGELHPSCGYMRAFVKRHEFFWTDDQP